MLVIPTRAKYRNGNEHNFYLQQERSARNELFVKDWKVSDEKEGPLPLVNIEQMTRELEEEVGYQGSFSRWTLIGSSKPAGASAAEDIACFIFLGVSH